MSNSRADIADSQAIPVSSVGKPRSLNNNSGDRIVPLLKVVALILFFSFLLLPFVFVFVVSFHSTIARPEIPSDSFTWINYLGVFGREDLRDSLINSSLYVLFNVSFTIPVALPAAYAFSRYRFVGDKHLFLAFIAFRITPPIVLSMPIFQLFAVLDLINSTVGIALAHCLFNLPICIWILESFLDGIPRELDETAFLDGYSMTRFFRKILIPMMMPGIGVAAFFCFMFSWVEVVFARILTITNGKPISMAINSLFGFSTDLGLIMAMTVVSLIPGVAMIWFVRNHLARGFQLGSN